MNTHVSAVVDSGGVRIPVEFDLPYDADVAEVLHAVSLRGPTGARLVDRRLTWEEPPDLDPDDISDEEFCAEVLAYAAELRESRRQHGDREAAVVEERCT